MKTFFQATAILAICALIAAGPFAPACTGITIKPKDGSIIFARTLEFAMDLKSNIIVVPRGKEYVGTAPGDKPGLRWKTKYGIVGTNAFDLPVTVDGLNEKGLSVGLFYFPGFAKYQEVKADDVGKALAPWELGSFLLGTCSDVKEAVAAAKSVRVGEVVQKDMGFVPPVHYIVTDASGNSVVLEYIGGELKVHANPLGVHDELADLRLAHDQPQQLRHHDRQQRREDRPWPARRSRALVKAAACSACPAISRRRRGSFGRSPFPRRPCRSKRPRKASCRRSTF